MFLVRTLNSKPPSSSMLKNKLKKDRSVNLLGVIDILYLAGSFRCSFLLMLTSVSHGSVHFRKYQVCLVVEFVNNSRMGKTSRAQYQSDWLLLVEKKKTQNCCSSGDDSKGLLI